MDKDTSIQQQQNKSNGNAREEMMKKRDEMLQKKKKIENMKSFLNLKRKIYSLINLGKAEEAKNTYDTLYVLYQNMLRTHKQEELLTVKNVIAEVFSELENALNKKKKIKKGHFAEVEIKKDEKKIAKL